MIASLLPSLGLAAINAASGTPAPGAPEALEISDIAPPVNVFPYPLWMVVVAGILAVAVLGLLVWMIVRWIRNRPGPPSLGATAIALNTLEQLRKRVAELEPYTFSVAVSDVLRTFISKAKFRLPATNQTSPELLAAISQSALFSESDRTLLTQFSEKCDMIKFARVEATQEDNRELVESALTFVRGGQA